MRERKKKDKKKKKKKEKEKKQNFLTWEGKLKENSRGLWRPTTVLKKNPLTNFQPHWTKW
jgi:hypothetical protein